MARSGTPILGIRRIVAGTLILLWLGINALALYYVSLEHKLVERTVVAETLAHGESWASRCAAWLAPNDGARAQELVEVIGGTRGVRAAWVVDASGRVIADTDRKRVGALLIRTPQELDLDAAQVSERHPPPRGFFHESGHNFCLRIPIRRTGRLLGVLGLEINTASANLEAKALGIKALTTLLLVSVIFAVAAVGVDRRLRYSVKQLTAAVRSIARGQLDQEVHLGTGDELDELGDSVNRMAEALQQSQKRVRHWQRQLEQVVAARTRQLEESQALLAHREKMAALGLMAAGIAHEVGNPLSAISVIVQRVEWSAEPKLREKCSIIRQQVERISKTIDELRQFARPDRSDRTSVVNANDVLRSAVQLCRYDPRAEKIRISTELDTQLSLIRGNRDRWQQVFLNLIINAFDAMPDGGALTLSSRCSGGAVEFAVCDSGTGMSREQLQKLFHPFYSTKSPDRGCGLGLSVCQGIVRSYGGRIEVDSEPGRGTRFRIIVPASSQQAQAASAPSDPGAAELPEPGLTGTIGL